MSVEILPNVSGNPEKFLDIDVLKFALEYALADCKSVEIVKIVYESGSQTGENYLGTIYRIKVHYRYLDAEKGSVQIHSFIAKCMPKTDGNAFVHECRMFLKEIICYREILPRLQLLNINLEKFSANLYSTVKKPMNILIFEDLQALKYGIASRESGLDLAHCSIFLQKLGTFHAMSMILGEKLPHLTRCLHAGILSDTMLKEDGMPLQYFASLLAGLEKKARTWVGYESIVIKLKKFGENFRENLLKLSAPQANDINVINHGDAWVNNILFKYADTVPKTPKDVIFVDFQMTFWGSLGLDINYFLNTSVQPYILKAERLRLLRTYYDALSSTLSVHQQQAQCKRIHIPTFSQVLHEVEKREGFGFFACFTMFPMISMDKELSSDSSVDNLANQEFANKKIDLMFASQKVEEALKYRLKRFDELGVLG